MNQEQLIELSVTNDKRLANGVAYFGKINMLIRGSGNIYRDFSKFLMELARPVG